MLWSRWSLFPVLAGLLWLGLASMMPRLNAPTAAPNYAEPPMQRGARSGVDRGRIGPSDPDFDLLAQSYRRHGSVIEHDGQIWLADDNGRTLEGFIAIAEAPTEAAMEDTIRTWWQRFYQDHRWGDWSQDWLKPEWLGELHEPLHHALMCRERRCLVGHDFDHEAEWSRAVEALQQRLPRHVELREFRTHSHALLVLTRY
ncbi:hypothetical protein KUV89_10870 [Marinobacter hydrocarbonoclasticus]|nr:hypothetical protein [Marinobacter nauticus]